MKKTKFEVPFNWTQTFKEFLLQNSNKIYSVYASLPNQPTGRPIPHPKHIDKNTIDYSLLEKTVNEFKSQGINFNLVMNMSCTGNIYSTPEGKKLLEKSVKDAYQIGISQITVSNYTLARNITNICPEIKIIMSVILNITSIEQIQYTINQDFNFTGFIVGKGIVRNIPKLTELVKSTKAIDIDTIVPANDFCPSGNCPERISDHNNSCSHKNLPFPESELGKQKYISPSSYCKLMAIKNPSYFLKAPIINPNDLHFYTENGINLFKLTDRIMPDQMLKNVCEAYFSGHYDGNLFDLFSFTSTLSDERPSDKKLTREEIRIILEGGYEALREKRKHFVVTPYINALALSDSRFISQFLKGTCFMDCYDERLSPMGCRRCESYFEKHVEIDKKQFEAARHNIELLIDEAMK